VRAGYKRDSKTTNESLLHKQAKSIATNYAGEIRCFVACNHPEHHSLVGEKLSSGRLHLVFGGGPRFAEFKVGRFRYDCVQCNVLSKAEITVDKIECAMEVQKTCANSAAKREHHESDDAAFKMAQVSAGELVAEHDRVRRLEDEYEFAKATSLGDARDEQLEKQARSDLDRGRVLNVEHHPVSALAPNWCAVCEKENTSRENERIARRAAEMKRAAEQEEDGQTVHLNVEKKRKSLENEHLANWCDIESFSQNGKHLRGTCQIGQRGRGYYTRCFLEEAGRFYKVLVLSSLIDEVRCFDGKEVFLKLAATRSTTGGGGVLQFVKGAEAFETAAPFEADLDRFKIDEAARVTAERQAKNSHSNDATGA
jgi:hypothetical protein